MVQRDTVIVVVLCWDVSDHVCDVVREECRELGLANDSGNSFDSPRLDSRRGSIE